jgi:hypothetical protein
VRSTDFAAPHYVIFYIIPLFPLSYPNIPLGTFVFSDILASKSERITSAGCTQVMYKKFILNSRLKVDKIFKTITAYESKWKDQVNGTAEPKWLEVV